MRPFALLLAFVPSAVACSAEPRTGPASGPTQAVAPVSASAAATDPPQGKTWKELYSDAPSTDLDTTGKDEATAGALRKLSVDVEVTYRELAKVTQRAPLGCPITRSSCIGEWTRYVTELSALKNRIARRADPCGTAGASDEQSFIQTHHEYQARAYEEHVAHLYEATDGADGDAALGRLLQGADKSHPPRPPCATPGD